jgi:putative tryptophan/tyrosine transport system substrate-binding protein
MGDRSALLEHSEKTVTGRPICTRARLIVLAIALGLAGVGWLPAAAQSAKPARVGVLFLTGPHNDPTLGARGLREGLREHGYVEGQSVVLEYRYAEDKAERLPQLAAGLVRARVDVMVVVGFQAALAARDATTTIPIVMAPVGDPSARGLVTNLARPASNVTGVSLMTTELIPKRLSLLKEVVPQLTRLGLVRHSSTRGREEGLKGIQRAAATMGIDIVWLEVTGPETLGALRQAIRTAHVQALASVDHPVTSGLDPRIAEIALQERLPTAFPFKEAAEAGGLMSYATNIVALQRRAATYVHRILNGTKPGDLPVEQADQFELVVNLKTANALGLKIPSGILLQASQVITGSP